MITEEPASNKGERQERNEVKEDLGTSQEQEERKDSTMSSGKSGLMISHSPTKELLTEVNVERFPGICNRICYLIERW